MSVKVKDKIEMCNFYVVLAKFKPILGLKDLTKLGPIKVNCRVTDLWNHDPMVCSGHDEPCRSDQEKLL